VFFYACHFCLTLHLTEPSWVRFVAEHNNMCYSRQHGVRSAHLLRFGEVFQWQFGVLFRCVALSITLKLTSLPSFALATPTDGSIKFCSFLFCEMICQN
jgi:hypothetical protein